MMKRISSPGYRDAFNFYSVVPREKARCSLDSFSLHSSLVENQELQSGVSIEENVVELNSKVQQLVVKVGVLAHDQATAEDFFTQFKQNSVTLAARIVILEEHIKEIESTGEENLVKERENARMMIENKKNGARIAKENYNARYQSMHSDHFAMVEEIRVMRLQVEMSRQQQQDKVEQFLQTKQLLLKKQEEHKILRENIAAKTEEWTEERKATTQLVQEMIKELAWLREKKLYPARCGQHMGPVRRSEAASDLSARLGEMQAEMRRLREDNRSCRESNEELEVALLSRGLYEGRELLTTQQYSHNAEKIETMSEDEMLTSLSEQKDVNLHLQSYIDNVLLNIMERYPELLEIRNK